MPKQTGSNRALEQAARLVASGKKQAAKSALRAERNKAVDDTITYPVSKVALGLPRTTGLVGKAKRPPDAVGGPTARKYQKMKGK